MNDALIILVLMIVVNAGNCVEPTLTLQYSKEPDIVFLDSELVVECLVSCGYFTGLQWVMIKGGAPLRFLGESAPDFASVTESKSCDDPWTNMTSILAMKVTRELDDVQIACVSARTLVKACGDAGSLCLRSNVFKTQHGPGSPFMSVWSDSPLDHLEEGGSIKATCAACVGTGGQILWALEHDGSLTMLTTAIPYVRSVDEDSDDSACGPVMNSTIELRVTQKLDHRKIMCFSFNIRDPAYVFPGKEYLHNKTSMLFLSPTALAHTLEERGYIGLLWYLIGVMLLGLIAFLLITSPADSSSDMDSNGESNYLEDLWNVEPEVSKIMSTSSEVKWHDVIDSSCGGMPGSPSLFVAVPSSLMNIALGRDGTKRHVHFDIEHYGTSVN